MRGTETEATGSAGQSEVKARFERLGWGVAATDVEHDLGTDLIVQARDARRFDQGDFMGVQVKTGDSMFKRLDEDAQGRPGWWYREKDDEHFDHWVNHGLPHLLVLHDLGTSTSYWAEVVAGAVVSTGKGNRIFVPAENTIDKDHLPALLAVATNRRPPTPLEGTSWTGATGLRARDRARHAIIAPRLIAPHPNLGAAAEITSEQAVALLVQVRLLDLARFAEKHANVPSLDDARDHDDWRWRFVAALGHRVLTGQIDQLDDLVDGAPDEAWRTIAVATTAASLIEEGRAAEAEELLAGAIARDRAEPVDHAWLRVQRARSLVEMGRIEDARADADAVQHVRISHPDDVTATAIASAGAALLFNTADFRTWNLEEFITGADTAVSWWRNQTKANGLTDLIDQLFRSWAHDTAITIGSRGYDDERLLSVTLSASFVGDHAAWRHGSTLLGRARLLDLDRYADPDTAVTTLQLLRDAGDAKTLRLAVQKLCDDGPAVAVTKLASSINLNTATRTTLRGDLAALRAGGDVIEEHTADSAITWLLAHPDVHEHLEVLAAVVPSGSLAACRQVLHHILNLVPDALSPVLEQAWTNVTLSVPEHAWTPVDRQAAGERADQHNEALKRAFQAMKTSADSDLHDKLVSEAESGSLAALAVLRDFRKIPSASVRRIAAHLHRRLEQQMSDADSGRVVDYAYDGAELLVLLYVYQPDQADWSVLSRFLSHPQVFGRDKSRALQSLTNCSDLLTDDAKAALEPAVQSLITQPASAMDRWFSAHPSSHPSAGAAATLLPLLRNSNETDRETLLNLLSGNSDERRWAARAAGRLLDLPEAIGVVIALANDEDPRVRAAAAAQLAYHAAEGSAGPATLVWLDRCIADPGTRVPIAVAGTLATFPPGNTTAVQILGQLGNHISARVRAYCSTHRATPAAE